ncbi:hypothetical protein MHYP_G00301290 [Metynnis hypsauchen]
MCQVSTMIKKDPYPNKAVDHLGVSMQAIPKAYCNLSTLSVKGMPVLSPSEISKAQQEDPTISEIWKALKQGDTNQVKAKSSAGSLLLREWDRLKFQQDVMYQITVPPGRVRRSQLVLPEKFRKMVLQSLHDDSGHLGIDKTYGLVKERFYWPKMKSDIEGHCKLCGRCLKRKTLPKRVASLFHMQSHGPLDLPEDPAAQEGQDADKDETQPDIAEHTNLQGTSDPQPDVPNTMILDSNPDPDSQDDLRIDETRQSNRQRKAPSRLTYDTPGTPSVSYPTVKYVSCLYKWISSPFAT